jgi:hypothetical protein
MKSRGKGIFLFRTLVVRINVTTRTHTGPTVGIAPLATCRYEISEKRNIDSESDDCTDS